MIASITLYRVSLAYFPDSLSPAHTHSLSLSQSVPGGYIDACTYMYVHVLMHNKAS